MQSEKRKKSMKKRVFLLILRVLRAIVEFFVKTKVIRKRRIETIIVE